MFPKDGSDSAGGLGSLWGCFRKSLTDDSELPGVDVIHPALGTNLLPNRV